MGAMPDDDTRQCAKCGETKQVDQFDARFIHKPVRLWCTTCRTARLEAQCERDVRERAEWAEQRAKETGETGGPWAAPWQAHDEEQLMSIMARGFTDAEAKAIRRIQWKLDRVTTPWETIKQLFLELQPPVTGSMRNTQIPRSARNEIYTQQGGRCFYCARELLPLTAHSRKLSTDGKSDIGHMLWSQRYNFADSGIPELDHKVPASRGGNDSRENLCYACRRCNQIKGVRTLEEFAAMPNDTLSRIDLDPETVTAALSYEGRGYGLFSTGRKPRRLPVRPTSIQDFDWEKTRKKHLDSMDRLTRKKSEELGG